MKNLKIQSVQFNYLQKSFTEWLDILGYAAPTVNSLPIHIRELLHYLEQQGCSQITQLTNKHVNNFLKYLLTRPNLTKGGGGLSSSTINKTVQAINTFIRYLNTTGKYQLDINTKRIENNIAERSILTQEEIKELYEITYETRRAAGVQYGQRDRAMLTLYYGCGLRRNEAINLNINDINKERSILHVKNGKGNKERLVPITPTNMDYLMTYLEEGRYWFLENHNQVTYYKKPRHKENTDNEAFLLGKSGKRIQDGLYGRLQTLKERAKITKPVGLHTLRHTIATHLLTAGMDIEEIAKFLGHATLESTQIYTHLTISEDN